MSSSPLILLFIYTVVIFAASVIGGRMSEYGVMTHMKTQVVMSLVAGFLVGVAFFHLLPHGLAYLPSSSGESTAMLWVVIGLISMIVLLRVFPFHQHDFSSEANPLKTKNSNGKGLLGIAVGLSLHAVTEGIALGTSARLGLHENGLLPGLGVCLAIVLHKPLDAYSITGLMNHYGKTKTARLTANIGYALVCPLVALASYFGAGLLIDESSSYILGCALAFAVGVFLCIALSDLLPEVHFHEHDRGKLILSLLIGVGLAYALYFVEGLAAH